jgi:hypothetical protein
MSANSGDESLDLLHGCVRQKRSLICTKDRLLVSVTMNTEKNGKDTVHGVSNFAYREQEPVGLMLMWSIDKELNNRQHPWGGRQRPRDMDELRCLVHFFAII